MENLNGWVKLKKKNRKTETLNLEFLKFSGVMTKATAIQNG
jgi:hypothetical protein